MESSSINLINWTNYLKGNYAKGVERLRMMLGEPNLYSRLLADFEALCVVCAMQDRSSADMCAAVKGSGKGDEVAEAYAGLAGYDGLAALAASAEAGVLVNMLSMSEAAAAAIFADSSAEGRIASDEEALLAIAGSAPALSASAGSDALVDALVSSGEAVGVITSSQGTLAAVLSSEEMAEAMMSSPTGLAGLEGSDAAKEIIYASDTLKPMYLGKHIASMAGLDPSDYADISALAADSAGLSAVASSSAAMADIAGSAEALNAVCKLSAFRTAWMGSDFAHTCYDTVYETLHGAPSSLFTKHEDCYETAYSGGQVKYALYSNASGGITTSSSTTAAHSHAVAFAGVTLLNEIVAGSETATVYYGSSQTKATLLSVSAKEAADPNLVLMGGMSFYNSASTYRGGNMNCKYATYAAV